MGSPIRLPLLKIRLYGDTVPLRYLRRADHCVECACATLTFINHLVAEVVAAARARSVPDRSQYRGQKRSARSDSNRYLLNYKREVFYMDLLLLILFSSTISMLGKLI